MSTTVNGVVQHPEFWTDSYKGKEYGILTVSAPDASKDGWHRALLDESWGSGTAGGPIAVCIKLKRKGPCRTAAQLCYGGKCVFTVKDRRGECCPTLQPCGRY